MVTQTRNYLESLGIEESLDQLSTLLTKLANNEAEVTAAKNALENCREALNLREAELLLDGLEGKNESERKAQLIVKQKADQFYHIGTEAVQRNEQRLSTAELKEGSLRREWQYHRIRLEVATAKLNFLAGVNGHNNGSKGEG